jgi:hypothetical protein
MFYAFSQFDYNIERCVVNKKLDSYLIIEATSFNHVLEVIKTLLPDNYLYPKGYWYANFRLIEHSEDYDFLLNYVDSGRLKVHRLEENKATKTEEPKPQKKILIPSKSNRIVFYKDFKVNKIYCKEFGYFNFAFGVVQINFPIIVSSYISVNEKGELHSFNNEPAFCVADTENNNGFHEYFFNNGVFEEVRFVDNPRPRPFR